MAGGTKALAADVADGNTDDIRTQFAEVIKISPDSAGAAGGTV
jgi:hypothetical protein